MIPSSGDRQLTLAYAAGASLAAVTLIYVFGPTWLIDSSNSSSGQRRKGVVGLVNTANDCFINSILQALAGLGELRAYLVRRTRNARANGELIGDGLTIDHKPFLTGALKDILDGLNERPIYRKTISARPFLAVLEGIFQQRISRAQQDAHEFLQVVAETLAEEYHQQKKLGQQAKSLQIESEEVLQSVDEDLEDEEDGGGIAAGGEVSRGEVAIAVEDPDNTPGHMGEDDGMPMEGKLEAEIECLECHFKPKLSVSTFVALTLPVPQKSYANLSECIDGVLSTEYIDDFQCAKCRIQHAIQTYSRKLTSSTSSSAREVIFSTIAKLEEALEKDPEKIPEGIELPPTHQAPKSRIARRTRMSYLPTIITFHLSRSIYDIRSSSRKNGARVSFPEELQMGGILDRKGYRLLCMITHKGSHDSGHYECFRRQIVHRPPYSTPTSTRTSPPTPVPSGQDDGSTVGLITADLKETMPNDLDPGSATLDAPSFSSSSSSSMSSTSEDKSTSRSSISAGLNGRAGPTELENRVAKPAAAAPTPPLATKGPGKKLRKKRGSDLWWRISDEKVKEARTSDVLGMKKEVYLLFYERIREE